MGRTKEQQAAYMREYRARKAKPKPVQVRDALAVQDDPWSASKRIAELEEEVRRLKRELAARPVPMPVGEMRPVVAEQTEHHFNTRPFRPVPKRHG